MELGKLMSVPARKWYCRFAIVDLDWKFAY